MTFAMRESRVAETPNTVHGRLLESVHVSGYTFERACGELEWLLDQDRWKKVGPGYKDINVFLATIDFSEFRLAIEQRKKLAKRLAEISGSQRTTAKVIGVGKTTIQRDLANGPNGPGSTRKSNNSAVDNTTNGPNGPEAWFQADADPSREAKRLIRKTELINDRAKMRAVLPSASLPADGDRYRLIYADPPWQYEHVKTESRAVENHYPTMTMEAICGLKVPAADDCVLFLWATSPKLAEAMRVIEAWEFTYRTEAVWDKLVIGMGYYFRQQHEHLLVATRGAIRVPDPDARPSSVIRERRSVHSEKPAIVYSYLEGMYPEIADRIELFARTPRAGWARWGNQI